MPDQLLWVVQSHGKVFEFQFLFEVETKLSTKALFRKQPLAEILQLILPPYRSCLYALARYWLP
jgi:hypothetical protein